MYYTYDPRYGYAPKPSPKIQRKVIQRREDSALPPPPQEAPLPPRVGRVSIDNATIDRAKRPSIPQNTDTDIVSMFALLGFIPLGIALCFEGVAFNEDLEWNHIVNSEVSFPSLNTIVYFNHHTITLDPNTRYNHHDLKASLLRNDYLEPAALACMTISAVMVFSAYFLYLQGEAMKNTLMMGHVIAGFLMMIAAICIFVSDADIDKMHLRAAAELDIVLETLLEEHRNPISQIPMEEIEESAMQTINLLAIQKACALGTSHQGRFSGSSATHYMYILVNKHKIKRITVAELRLLRFCSREDYKHVAATMAIIYSLVCLLIPLISYCMDRRQKKSQVQVYAAEPESYKQKESARAPPPPPPAYGYGYPAQQQQQQKAYAATQPLVQEYDPRLAPVAPTIPLDELLELEYTQLALLHKQAKERAGDEDADFQSMITDTETSQGKSRDNSRSPRRDKEPTSKSREREGRSRNRKKKDKKQRDRSGESAEEKISELEKKLEYLENKVNRVEQAHRSASAPKVRGDNQKVSKNDKGYSSEMAIRRRQEESSGESKDED